MAKPILVVTTNATPQQVDAMLQVLNKKIGEDYHVFAILGKEAKVQMFSDKEIEPIELEELKNLVNHK